MFEKIKQILAHVFHYEDQVSLHELNMKPNMTEIIQKAKFKQGSKVKHRKGGTYNILGMCFIEATLVPAYIYVSNDSNDTVWVRPITEMEDGRFEMI